MIRQVVLQVIQIIAGLWAAGVFVVIGCILTGRYHPVRDDFVPAESMPWVWAWYGVQITACVALAIWSTIRLRTMRPAGYELSLKKKTAPTPVANQR